MMTGKAGYLDEITKYNNIRSLDIGDQVDGSSPPSVFIGSWNYPKVFAGPMLSTIKGDTSLMDSSERWIPEGSTQSDIISYRLGLVRGKKSIDIMDTEDKLVEKLQDITLSRSSIGTEVKFRKTPVGVNFSEDTTTYGPSGDLEKLQIESTRWDRDLERVYYDTDLRSTEALSKLHSSGTPFSSIQKAFSTGTMGIGKNRKMVPTRWSITAVDSTLGNNLLDEVKNYDPIDTFRVHEFASLNNYYTVILLPTMWQYEWMEAFLKIKGSEEMLFGDFELFTGKKGYSRVGGCFYTCRMAVLEELARQKKQAGAIILREAYKGYVPLGVFNVRENVRNAMVQKPLEFEDLKKALDHVSGKLHLPMKRYISTSDLLKEVLHHKQSRLEEFIPST